MRINIICGYTELEIEQESDEAILPTAKPELQNFRDQLHGLMEMVEIQEKMRICSLYECEKARKEGKI